jgi:hypothetical protein
MEEDQERGEAHEAYAEPVDRFDPGMGPQLAGLRARGDERAVVEGAAILAPAAPLVTRLHELRPDDHPPRAEE